MRAKDFESNVAENGISWDHWDEAIDAIKDTDFGCQWDCNGCAGSRVGFGDHATERACCFECADHFGYYEAIRPEHVARINAEFNDDTGFWGPNGCRLPIELRSGKCISYCCSLAFHNLSVGGQAKVCQIQSELCPSLLDSRRIQRTIE